MLCFKLFCESDIELNNTKEHIQSSIDGNLIPMQYIWSWKMTSAPHYNG